MDSHFRSICKSVSWRIWATLITFFISWLLTGKFETAASIGLLDSVIKIGMFYGHERLWNNINIGRKKITQYSIAEG
ncbi:MAG: DUF2061 domain-containing protein [Phycisphaerae bacterium]|nr:DUF2061 domain-containing protein [Phycisphaerae bacterium]